MNFLLTRKGGVGMWAKVAQLCLTLCNPMDYRVHGILQSRILEWVAFPLLQEIFPTQGSNPGLPHCRRILYHLSHKGSPRILEWVAYPFSRSSDLGIEQGLHCRRILSNSAIREAWGRNGEFLRARSSGALRITSAVLNGILSSLCARELMPF